MLEKIIIVVPVINNITREKIFTSGSIEKYSKAEHVKFIAAIKNINALSLWYSRNIESRSNLIFKFISFSLFAYNKSELPPLIEAGAS